MAVGNGEMRPINLGKLVRVNCKEQQASKNTAKKTASDMRVFERYCKTINEERAIETTPVEELDVLLGKDVPKLNGDNYEPDSLTAFQRSINRHIQLKRSDIDNIKDRSFATSRAILAAKRKLLRKVQNQMLPRPSP